MVTGPVRVEAEIFYHLHPIALLLPVGALIHYQSAEADGALCLCYPRVGDPHGCSFILLYLTVIVLMTDVHAFLPGLLKIYSLHSNEREALAAPAAFLNA
jgi:hypothetical protein